MILNRHVSPFEWEGIFYKCGCFYGGTVKLQVFTKKDFEEFLMATEELFEEWRKDKELYHFWGFVELERKIDRKIGLEK